MILYPTFEVAIATHDRLIAKFGGSGGLRDRGALESALAEQQQATAQANALEGRVKSASLRASRLQQAAKAGAGDIQSADDAMENARQAQAELDNASANAALGSESGTIVGEGVIDAPPVAMVASPEWGAAGVEAPAR